MTPDPTSQDEAADMPPNIFHFGSFNVTSQVFHTTAHTIALVNLRPLLPGHILVSPLRVLPRLSDLSTDEISDLFNTVTRIQRTLTRLYRAEGFNVAVQDGEAAGQSVPHVHCHVIPRARGDGGEGDKVHEWLEGEEGDVGGHLREAQGQQGGGGERKAGQWARDEERRDRSAEVMREEAEWLRREMERDAKEGEGKL